MYVNIQAELFIMMPVFPYYDDDQFDGLFSTYL